MLRSAARLDVCNDARERHRGAVHARRRAMHRHRHARGARLQIARRRIAIRRDLSPTTDRPSDDDAATVGGPKNRRRHRNDANRHIARQTRVRKPRAKRLNASENKKIDKRSPCEFCWCDRPSFLHSRQLGDSFRVDFDVLVLFARRLGFFECGRVESRRLGVKRIENDAIDFAFVRVDLRFQTSTKTTKSEFESGSRAKRETNRKPVEDGGDGDGAGRRLWITVHARADAAEGDRTNRRTVRHHRVETRSAQRRQSAACERGRDAGHVRCL